MLLSLGCRRGIILDMNTNFRLSDYWMNIGGVLLLVISLLFSDNSSSTEGPLQLGMIIVSFFYVFFGSFKIRSIKMAFLVFLGAEVFQILASLDHSLGSLFMEMAQGFLLVAGVLVLLVGGVFAWGVEKLTKNVKDGYNELK